jgi:hypothetical protein
MATKHRLVLNACGLILLYGSAVFAQTPTEIFVGPSYLRQGSVNLYGWHASAVGNVNSWAGFKFDLSGHYSSPDVSVLTLGVPTTGYVNVSLYSARAGPQFTLRTNRMSLFAHGLLGATFVRSAGYIGEQKQTKRLDGFSLASGVGLDININDRTAWRLIEADYSFFRVYGAPSHGVRLSMGIVVRLDEP